MLGDRAKRQVASVRMAKSAAGKDFGHRSLPEAASLTRAGPHSAILGTMFRRRLPIRPIASRKSGGGSDDRRNDDDTLEAFHACTSIEAAKTAFPVYPAAAANQKTAHSHCWTPRAISTAA